MGKSPLILAALASEAVPGLRFSRVQPLEKNTYGIGDTALLTAESGEHYIIRLAKTGAAGADQDADLAAVQTLSALNLPFEVAKLVGETRAPDGGRALLFKFIYGDHIDLETLNPNDPLTSSLGSAIAAIHNLPVTTIQDAGFPEYDPSMLVQSRIAELDLALETGKIPPVLLDRWERAFEDVSLFRFQPTVIHGSIDSESVVALGSEVTGIRQWSDLMIADPAEDLAWIVGSANESAAYNVLVAYLAARPTADPHIRTRAKLYSEFNYASWLLHALKTRNQDDIDLAVADLASLADQVEQGMHGSLTAIHESFSVADIPDEIPASFDEPFEFDDSEALDSPVTEFAETAPSDLNTPDDHEYGTTHTEAIHVTTEALPEVDDVIDPTDALDEPDTEAVAAGDEDVVPVYEATLEDDQEPYYYAETVEIVVAKENPATEGDNRLF
jgi:aminoglycoside phosphotransferase (APT) family kinase protein